MATAKRAKSNHSSSVDTKNIHIYQNGDAFFPGIRCAVNPRQTRNFDSFLTFLTNRLKPSFGAVRNVYTPVHGHRVTHLEKLKSNKEYVAAGTERFKKISPGYSQIKSNKKRAPVKSSKSNGPIKPVIHSNIQASARFRTSKQDTITIYIYKNGDDKNQPVKFVLGPRDTSCWENFLQTVGEKVQLQSGFVKNGISWADIERLYKLDGTAIDYTNLENGKQYVAVGRNETFKRVAYGEHKDWKSTSVKNKKQKVYGSKLSGHKHNRRQADNHARPASTSSQVEKDIESLNRLVKHAVEESTADSYTNIQNDKEELEASASLIEKMLELEAADLGVYKAKDGGRTEAYEIQDSPDTMIEVPIDQLEAEEIKEEDLKAEVQATLRRLSISAPEQLIAVASKLQNKRKKPSNIFRITTNKNTLPAA